MMLVRNKIYARGGRTIDFSAAISHDVISSDEVQFTTECFTTQYCELPKRKCSNRRELSKGAPEGVEGLKMVYQLAELFLNTTSTPPDH
jgi:hypothetical protein